MAAKKKRNCTKGKSCGASCIAKSRVCKIDAANATSKALTSTSKKVKNRSKKVKEGSISEKLAKALPEYTVKKTSEGLEVSRMAFGNEIRVTLSKDRVVDFTLNGGYSPPKTSLSPENSAALSGYIRKAVDEMVKSMKDGTTLRAKSTDSPGRQAALNKLGFSLPATVGGPQVGKVEGGKLVPSTPPTFDADRTSLSFTEKVKDKLWHVVLFGRKP